MKKCRFAQALVLAIGLTACGASPGGEMLTLGIAAGGSESSSGGSSTGADKDGFDSVGESTTLDDSPPPPPPVVFDLGGIPDAPPGECGAPQPHECDNSDDDPLHAVGLNCPGGPEVDGILNGDPRAFHVHEGNIGTLDPPPYPPREGNKVLIMSSGRAADLLTPGLFASTDVVGFVDNGAQLPAPMIASAVSA